MTISTNLLNSSLFDSSEKNRILKRHKPEYTQCVMAATDLYKELASIVADYVVDGELMDRNGWQEHFGVDIGPETAEVQEALKFENFYKIYHGPNPVDVAENVPSEKMRQVCESSLIPIVRPHHIGRIHPTHIFYENYSLSTLGNLAENPVKGRPAKYFYNSEPLQQYGTTKARPSALVIMLKDVVARKKTWSRESQNPNERGQVQYLRDLNTRTGFGCKIEPDALSQITVLFAHHTITGEHSMRADTYARTAELVKQGPNSFRMASGSLRKSPMGGPAPTVLGVIGINYDGENYGVAVMRES